MALEIPYICTSKISLFWPRLILTICHFLLFQLDFYINAAPIPPFLSLDLLYQSLKSDPPIVPSRMVFSLSLTTNFPRKINLNEAKIGSVPSAGSMQLFVEICLANRWS